MLCVASTVYSVCVCIVCFQPIHCSPTGMAVCVVCCRRRARGVFSHIDKAIFPHCRPSSSSSPLFHAATATHTRQRQQQQHNSSSWCFVVVGNEQSTENTCHISTTLAHSNYGDDDDATVNGRLPLVMRKRCGLHTQRERRQNYYYYTAAAPGQSHARATAAATTIIKCLHPAMKRVSLSLLCVCVCVLQRALPSF